MIYDKFDEINGKYRKDIKDRLKRLILGLDMYEVVIPNDIAKKYYDNVSLQMIKSDIKKLIELDLLKTTENGLYPNIDILNAMLTKQLIK